ncbi:MAG TPA: TonB-dependent receptor [Accumulibacter sp.]|nr:TonB-dependent receptor [Accumulibacter sp.]HMW17435.1 TonB-dependent receptor [Accumulibacter sp.]HMX22045.1 TonB-dependent receptor [Accumulibacter sp.]HMY06763.1 TonB-dependent receptor [Accumulibacter sp.]HNC17973.1 TonB-dependent receptor [Accumulibacter sp.]
MLQPHKIRVASSALATVIIAPLSSASLAAEEPSLAPVVVTATRFSEPDPGIAANVSVITGQDLRHSPAQNLPDVLRSRAGIDVRQLSGAMGRDAAIDLRGFGSTATSNTLILLDGQRLNPIDMGSILWSSIPLESVDRIEIIRGSGTVLYGDGATGGVINIITNKSARSLASISATAGSYGYRGADAQLGHSNGQAYYRLFLNYAAADGYRQNSQQDQRTASGRLGWLLDNGEVFAEFAIYKESAGLPGSIFSAAFNNDPRSTRTPYNIEQRDGYRLRPGVSYNLTDRLSLEAEIAFEHQLLDAKYYDPTFGNSGSRRSRDTLSFTPRLRWRHDLGALPSETVFGLDHYDGKVTSDNSGYANQGAEQQSTAFYLQNVTRLTDRWTLTTGGRQQRVKQQAHQEAYAPFFSPAMVGDATRTREAYDLGLTYTGQGWRIYGKTGTTFRFANVDELFGLDLSYNPVFAGDLKPQHGRTSELGGSVTIGLVDVRAAVYQLDLVDELGYDAALFRNVNFAPTRRRGGELEAAWKVVDGLSLKAAYAYTDAYFRSGTYEGRQVPLVPHHQASIQAIWEAGQYGTYSAITRHVGERRYSSDFSNTHGMLAGYTTLDLQAVWQFKPWKISAKVLNAFDRKYSPQAGYAASYSDTYYYPADGRGFYVVGRYDF